VLIPNVFLEPGLIPKVHVLLGAKPVRNAPIGQFDIIVGEDIIL
jgi:hypothetical protein